MRKHSIRKFVDNVQPVLKMGRSKFDLSYSIKTSMDVGDLVPVYIQEIYPGDTFKDKTTFVARSLSPFLRPVMDNLFLDIYFFFVPNRLVWTRWQELMGENVSGYWKQASSPTVPTVALPYAIDSPAINYKSIANYFGINIDAGMPTGSTETPFEISDLPFRANALIYNEWFRNENFEAPVYINTGDYGSRQFLNNNAWSASNFHGLVPKVNKLSDYFTMCLPEPQKGNAVDIPIDADVIPTTDAVDYTKYAGTSYGLTWYDKATLNTISSHRILGLDNYGLTTGFTGDDFSFDTNLLPKNLHAVGNTTNINDLRFAFQLQKMLEKDARGGTRYVEYLASHFGVISPDARLQRPEFLGGKRVPLQLQEVAQTSQPDTGNPLGQLAAYSATVNNSGFSKGFVEHGFVIGYAVIRYRHTYQQGIERFWTRKSRYDFYDPVFANIGEQPVYRYELYANGLHAGNANTIFGYNEAWADLRYRPSRITGILNSTQNAGFDVWTFGDYYATAPVLGNTFMKETSAFVDRTLTVPSSTAPNFIIDFYHKNIGARVMPLYSIPGLVDHH